MTTATSAEFQKNFGTYKKLALEHPVTVLIHGKPTLVVISKSEFDQLSGAKGAGISAPGGEHHSSHGSLSASSSDEPVELTLEDVASPADIAKLEELFAKSVKYRDRE